MRRIAFVLPAIVLSGCILGIDNLSGGEGASDSGSTDDASGDDVAVGNDSSAPTDSGTLDSSTSDGGNEGGPFCPQIGALLCSDFDDVDAQAALPGPWDSLYAPSPAFVITTTTQFKSAPRSVKIGTVSAAVVAVLEKTVTTKHVALSFDMFMEALGGNPSFASFTIGGAGQVVFQPGSILEADMLSDGGTSYGSASGVGIATGTWVHIDCVMDLTTHVATVSHNGAQTASRSLATTPNWTGSRTINVAIGFGDSNNTTIDYDNVTISIE
jgi:hypothetical protein